MMLNEATQSLYEMAGGNTGPFNRTQQRSNHTYLSFCLALARPTSMSSGWNGRLQRYSCFSN